MLHPDVAPQEGLMVDNITFITIIIMILEGVQRKEEENCLNVKETNISLTQVLIILIIQCPPILVRIICCLIWIWDPQILRCLGSYIGFQNL